MEFLYLEDNWVSAKVFATAAAANIALQARKVILEELQRSSPLAIEVVLLAPRKDRSPGVIAACTPILRFLATAAPASLLLGCSAMDGARVDQWLQLVWNDVEVPCHILKLRTGGAAPEATVRVAMQDLRVVLERLDAQLATSMFLAGPRLTLADIALGCVLLDTAGAPGVALALEPLLPPHLRRYLAQLSTHPALRSALPDAALKALAPAGAVPLALPSAEELQGKPPSRAGNVAADAVCRTAFQPVAVPPGRFQRDRTRLKELFAKGAALVGQRVTVKGWVRTLRAAAKNKLIFIEVNDGSCVEAIQVVCTSGDTEGFATLGGCGGTGASLAVVAEVVATPKGGQAVELQAVSVEVLGCVTDPATYPMSKKSHTLEYLRDQAHLRPRTRIYASLARVRHALAFATHKFFNDHGFLYVHTPLITAADCEGAGEQFCVTTLLAEHGSLTDVPTDAKGRIDHTKDFFGRRASLTVSGQLNVETHCCALGDVYTFGPTFRAEDSHTSRHLAEFWMIEPEVAFADLARDIDLAEDYLKYCVRYALAHCASDLEYFESSPLGEPGLRDRLENVIAAPFHRMTYTEAIELLQAHVATGQRAFQVYPDWGIDLGSEHERYLAEVVFEKPVVLTDYPKGIKAFYMRLNDDGETVAAADVLVPKIGEVIGGSQREERLEVLQQRCLESGLPLEAVWWYCDLRKYGSIQHSGFGLGFERLLMLVTGLTNIRDVIPFPRYPGKAEF